VKNFSEAIRIDPAKADFYSNRGFTYRKIGEFEEAVTDYTSAIEINPRKFGLIQVTSRPTTTARCATRSWGIWWRRSRIT
jgi:tetratricopeptide (TPR) repeat protein